MGPDGPIGTELAIAESFPRSSNRPGVKLDTIGFEETWHELFGDANWNSN